MKTAFKNSYDYARVIKVIKRELEGLMHGLWVKHLLEKSTFIEEGFGKFLMEHVLTKDSKSKLRIIERMLKDAIKEK